MHTLSSEQSAFAREVADLVVSMLICNPPPRRETYTLSDLRTVLACESDSAVYRSLKVLKIAAYSPGKYRRKDVENQIAKASFHARRAAGYLDEKGRELEPRMPQHLR